MSDQLPAPALKRKWTELLLVLLLASLTTVLFWDGQLDITLADHFFHPNDNKNLWPEQTFWLWKGLYDLGHPLLKICLFFVIVLLIGGCVSKKCKKFRYRAAYFLLIIALGPGVLVNLVLKDHWGRPRPREIVEFSGQYLHQPPLVISNTGKKSFVCGHCSTGYMFFALYFILSKGRTATFILTLAYSLLMGLARMSAGGHFASDILWSGYVVFLLSWFLYYFVFREFDR